MDKKIDIEHVEILVGHYNRSKLQDKNLQWGIDLVTAMMKISELQEGFGKPWILPQDFLLEVQDFWETYDNLAEYIFAEMESKRMPLTPLEELNLTKKIIESLESKINDPDDPRVFLGEQFLLEYMD